MKDLPRCISVRPETHAKLKAAAAREGTSMALLLSVMVDRAIRREQESK